MPEDEMLTIDVHDENVNLLFRYKAWIVPSKGEYIFSTEDAASGHLKVEKVVAFPGLPENFDVYVKVKK